MVMAGDVILAGDFADGSLGCIGDVLVVRKDATETVNNSAAVQDDDHLVGIVLPASGLYIVDFFGAWIGNFAAGGTADVQTNWVLGGGAVSWIQKFVRGPAASNTDPLDTNARVSTHGITTAIRYGIASSSGVSISVHEHFGVETSTAGTLTLQWAQGTATSGDTVASTATHVVITRVG